MTVRLDQRGGINILLIPLILTVFILVCVLGFAFWAFGERATYKNDSDKLVAKAVAEAVADTQQTDALKYAEEAKKPYDTWIGDAAFGNVTINYPKTWSGYVVEKPTGGKPISAFYNPSVVPDANNPDNTFALRVELVQQSYDSVVTSFGGSLKTGKVTLQPYTLAKVPSVVGSRIEGQITAKKQGSMIVLPVRNATLKIWTESNDFKGDLDTHILPNLSFVP
jgi:hypothetical protein